MNPTKKDKSTGDVLGTGRRKSAVARIRLRTGTGKITVNGRTFEEYFTTPAAQAQVVEPLDAVNKRGEVDVIATVHGGGPIGQAGACRMGIARALCGLAEETFPSMRGQGFLTRDSRMKERKKPGLRGARRGTQFSKR
jgi:small subunit ribosomal protein S9